MMVALLWKALAPNQQGEMIARDIGGGITTKRTIARRDAAHSFSRGGGPLMTPGGGG